MGIFTDVRRRAKKTGQAPGTLIYTGSKINALPSIAVVTYDGKEAHEQRGHELKPEWLKQKNNDIIWVNVEGLHDVTLIQTLSEHFKLHPLTVEDILNIGQRPKVEEFDDYIFVIIKVLDWQTKTSVFSVKQLSLVLGKNFVLTFQELDTDRFDIIRKRLLGTSNQRLREQGADYLAYRLIDSVVDEYFVVLEAIGDKVEQVEDRIITDPTPQNARTIYRLKRQMLLLRKALWPMREAVSHLLHVEELFVTRYTRIYLRDVYDHAMQAIDTLETFRDMLASLLDMYLTSLTNRMNEIMKTLTIITTIFIPITAIGSIYGMNFLYLPGSTLSYGFVGVLALMLMIAVIMLIYFRKKKWI